jgi:type I restriction enzyme S subunit
MIKDLKPYPEYRQAEVPWLGQVPRHWEVRRIKTVLRETDRRATDGEGTLLSLTRVRGLIPHREMTVRMHSAKTLVGYKCYRDGQLVMNRMQAWSGMFGAGPIPGLVSPDYAVFDVLRGHSVKFLLERLKSPDLVAQFALESKGIGSGFNRLYTDRFGPIPIPLPPPGEQEAIVRFLTWANGRIERAIRSKRKVIALLNEQKQAIIHRAVTRGLDPNVALKPSGVPWLGDIPAHWELRRLKSLLLRNDGGVWGSDFTPDGTVVLRSTEQAVDGSWQIISPAVIRLSESQIKSAVLEAGDIVVTKSSGSATHIGKASLVSSEVARMRCCYSNFMQRLRANAQLVPEYLHLFLNSNTGRTHYQYMATSTTGLGNLTRETIATLPIPLPLPSEQLHILDNLKRRLWPLNESLSRLEREIDLLTEYRTSLVADVVTGKLDVREAAVNLPDEITLDTTSSEDISDDIDNLDEETSE